MKPIELNIEGFPEDFDFYNDQYPPLDALTYWHFLKGAQKVIEVGCGYSTYLAQQSGVNLFAIDPEPRIKYPNVTYLQQMVQAVPLSVFMTLEKNDILFVDSSHIYDIGSDVEFLIRKVLPVLRKGVIVHFHDYFGEYGYPNSWKEDSQMQLWNENKYLLSLTKKHKVLADNFIISLNHNTYLKNKYSFVPDNITKNLGAVKGASLWITIN